MRVRPVRRCDLRRHSLPRNVYRFAALGEFGAAGVFDKLRVDISSPEGFRIGGRVDTYDGATLAGFKGEGTIAIPGFPELSAAFAFVRMRQSSEQPWRHGWFVAIEASKISYQLTPLPIFLRHVGLGFGYRFTLPLILEFEKEGSIRDLMQRMLKALDKHQTLARIDSWVEDPESNTRRALWTIALEAAFTLGTSQATPFDYDPKEERQLKTLIAQIIAAFRSDFTLVAAAKLWFPVSIDDFFNDVENMRSRPLASGFMIYSAPQNRFLAHAAKGADPYMGPKNEPVPEIVKDILRKVHFEATLLIEPGLLHGELGWPDRLMFSFDLGGLKLECRGGVLFRLERDVLIQGTYFAGRGTLDLAGGVDFGFLGVRIEAQAVVQFASRMLTAQYPLRLLDSKIYAQQGLDIAVRFRLRAWFRLKIGFVKISIDISFSFEIQIAVAMEMGWAGGANLGFRARANIMVAVFGRRLSIAVAVGLNEGGVDKARAVLAPYMSSLLEAGKAPPMPGFDKVSLDEGGMAPFFAAALKAAPAAVIRDRFVTAHMEREPDSDGKTSWFVWIMPGVGDRSYFYPPVGEDPPNGEDAAYATLDLTGVEGDIYYPPAQDGQAWVKVTETKIALRVRPTRKISSESDDGETTLTVDRLIAGCWLPDQTDDEMPFPVSWPEIGAPLTAPTPPDLPDETISDARVFDPLSPARKPTYQRDETNLYDNTLAAALESADADLHDLNQQALGNQGLVMQAYYDEFARVSKNATVSVINSEVVITTPAETEGRPTPLDLGMLVCVRAKDKPAWIKERQAADVHTIVFPKLEFQTTHGGQHGTPFEPDAGGEERAAGFHKESPSIGKLTTYFDEDVIAVAFPIDWAGEPSGSDFAGDKLRRVEDFVSAYEITFSDRETQTPIRTVTVAPSETIVPDAERRDTYKRVSTRYKYSVPRSQVLPEGTIAKYNRTYSLGVAVVAISQSGRRSRQLSKDITFEPALTPMPADAARLTLSHVQNTGRMACRVDWRQLSLPSRPGVTATQSWQLILRPLREVPLGSYPDDTVDVNDRGLMSATGQVLLDGDIVLALEPKNGTIFTATRPTEDEQDFDRREGRDPADLNLTLNLGDSAITTLPGAIYDHAGQLQAPGSQVYSQALSFFQRTSAAEPDGKAWRLFVRASSQPVGALPAQQVTWAGVSGLSIADLTLSLPALPKGKRSDQDMPRLRPLPHFEWPIFGPSIHNVGKVQLKRTDLAIPKVGAVSVGVPIAPNQVDQPPEISFLPQPGSGRAITLAWNAIPADKKTPMAAYAAFDVFELRQDTLVNADLLEDSEFLPQWTWLKRVAPTESALARQTPLAMADTPNWECQTPVFAKSARFLDLQAVDPRDQLSQWPGWYSWAESDLTWPQPNVFQSIKTEVHTDLPLPTNANAQERLCYWRELGFGAAKALQHDFLAALIGSMAERGRWQSNPRFEVQAAPPAPRRSRTRGNGWTPTTSGSTPMAGPRCRGSGFRSPSRCATAPAACRFRLRGSSPNSTMRSQTSRRRSQKFRRLIRSLQPLKSGSTFSSTCRCSTCADIVPARIGRISTIRGSACSKFRSGRSGARQKHSVRSLQG
uniref:hypothetical protein n=1 Tax=Neorhizobium sp. EC2-8 TaxID=3129230 RepID=UPI003100FC86